MGWPLFLLSSLHTLLDHVYKQRKEEFAYSIGVCLKCGLGDQLSAGYLKDPGLAAFQAFVGPPASQTQSNRRSFHSFTFRRWRLW